MKNSVTKKQIKELCEFHANTFKPCTIIHKGNDKKVNTVEDAIDILWQTAKINGALVFKFDKIFQLYGREYGENYTDSFFLYTNTGETYAPTIIYSYKYDKYYVMSVGDFMKRAECRKLREG